MLYQLSYVSGGVPGREEAPTRPGRLSGSLLLGQGSQRPVMNHTAINALLLVKHQAPLCKLDRLGVREGSNLANTADVLGAEPGEMTGAAGDIVFFPRQR